VQLATTDGKIYVDNYGDVNLDGRVDVADVVAVVGYILGDFSFTFRQFYAGDVTHDALVDVFDLVEIINQIFGTTPTNTAPSAPGAPARLDLVYNAADGAHGAYRMAADLPADVAGAQFEINYDPKTVKFADPERLPASAGILMLRYRDNGKGRLVALLLYNPTMANSAIKSGTSEILRLPLAANSERPVAGLVGAKLSDPSAGKIEVAGFTPLPRNFVLEQNYPNPFNAGTSIAFTVDAAGLSVPTRLEIFNVLGQRVTTLVDGDLAPGRHTRTWDGNDAKGNPVASGVYFYRLTSAGHTDTKKMVLLK